MLRDAPVDTVLAVLSGRVEEVELVNGFSVCLSVYICRSVVNLVYVYCCSLGSIAIKIGGELIMQWKLTEV